jgi:DNA polymerase-3 subunit epsilon
MHSLWHARYVVVDVETTGGDPQRHRIIEICCLVLEDGTITDRFATLVNAHQPVPPSITALTGITNSMLLCAPEEEEVFARVRQLLEPAGTIFVAHNASFDWRFLQATLERLGYSVALPQLCTYRLARRLLPATLRRKGLDSLIAYFGIPVAQRHRAEPDAEATAAVLSHLLQLAARQGLTTPQDVLRLQYAPLPGPAIPQRLRKLLRHAPARPGVYELYDRRGQLLYIGKAANLQQRLRAHFTGPTALHRLEPIGDIRWQETPTELTALLREIEAIVHRQPPYNRAGKELEFTFLRLTDEPFPRLEVCGEPPHGSHAWIGPFPSRSLALHLLQLLQSWYQLRSCGSALSHAPHERACLAADLRLCAAPCNGSISAAAYRQRAHQLLDDATYHLARWVHAVWSALERHRERWEFEQAAQLRPLWRFLRRWHASRLPLLPTAWNFLLRLPLPTGGEELLCFYRGIFCASRLLPAPTTPEHLQQFLTELFGADGCPPSSPVSSEAPTPAPHAGGGWAQVTALDIARMDILSRWLARNGASATLVFFDPVTYALTPQPVRAD